MGLCDAELAEAAWPIALQLIVHLLFGFAIVGLLFFIWGRETVVVPENIFAFQRQLKSIANTCHVVVATAVERDVERTFVAELLSQLVHVVSIDT